MLDRAAHRHPRTTAVLKLSDGTVGLAADITVLSREEAAALGQQLIDASRAPLKAAGISVIDEKGTRLNG